MPPQSTFYDFLNPSGAHSAIDDLIDEYPIPTIGWFDKYENWKEGWLEKEEELEMERPTKERELMSPDALKDLFKIMRPAIEEIYGYMGYEDTGEAFDSLLSKTESGTILSYLTDMKDPALKTEYKDERLKKLRSSGRFNPSGGRIGEGKEGASQYIPLGSSFLTREDPDTVFAGNIIQNTRPGMDQSYFPSKDFVGPMPRYGKPSKQHESRVMKENLRSLLHETRHIDPITGDILPHFREGSLTGLKFDYPLYDIPSIKSLPLGEQWSKQHDKLIVDMLSKLLGETPEKSDINRIYEELGY